jgi:hypothetical protein
MKGLMMKCAAALPLMLCLPGLAAAADFKCRTELLRGQYVFTATGFTRPANSMPGTPWVPKAILEVLQFNGDSTLTTPTLTVAIRSATPATFFSLPKEARPARIR